MNIINKINNYLSKYCIFIFGIVTLIILAIHVPFWDETHAFNISRLNLSEIFYLTRIEGHTVLWYLILKPFSSLNLYPHSMFILNWIFFMFALNILWKNAPFSPIIKTLITFSTPFLFYFSVIARCYSIGLLFLFLICKYYKKRFKKPILYSTLILLAANTSILAGVGAFYITLIYLYEIFLKYKNKTFSKKNLIIVLSILFLCFILILIQFIGIRKPAEEISYGNLFTLFSFLVIPRITKILPLLFHIVVFVSIYYFAFTLWKNSKKGLFFICCIYLTLSYIFVAVYGGGHWNHYFYFVYFIILFWLFKKQLLKTKFSKFLFATILILSIFPKAILETGKMDLIYSSKSNIIAKEIISKKLYDKKLYSLEWWNDVFPGASCYLAKNNINIYDLHNRNRSSFESLKNIFYMADELIDFDKFYQNMDKNSYLLATHALLEQKFTNLIISEDKNKNLIFKTTKNKYLLKKIDSLKNTNVLVFKIEKI